MMALHVSPEIPGVVTIRQRSPVWLRYLTIVFMGCGCGCGGFFGSPGAFACAGLELPPEWADFEDVIEAILDDSQSVKLDPIVPILRNLAATSDAGSSSDCGRSKA